MLKAAEVGRDWTTWIGNGCLVDLGIAPADTDHPAGFSTAVPL